MDLDTLCEDVQIACERLESREGWERDGSSHWTVTLTHSGRTYTTPYTQGAAFKDPPAAFDVVYALIQDYEIGNCSHEEFCSRLGEDVDSRTAYAAWGFCAQVTKTLPEFLGNQFEAFYAAAKEW